MEALTSKGHYNVSDLNRVCEATDYIANLLQEYGYKVDYSPIFIPHRMPQKYQELEYIQSTGSQYIATGINPTSNTRIVCDFQFTQTLSAFQSVFGGRGKTPTYEGRFCFHLTEDGLFRSDYNDTNELFDSSISPTGRHLVDKNRNVCKLDSATVTNSDGDFTGQYQIYAFGGNTYGEATELANLKIYSMKIYGGEILVRDFIPVYDMNGEACLYDKITNNFFRNSGMGKFAASQEFNPDDIVSINTTWQREDIPLKSQMDKYLKNISAIRSAISVYETTPEPPSSMDNLTWKQANNIEKILFDLDEIITKMEQAWFYSGDLYSGEV